MTFRHNTVAGDLPSLAYAMRLNREGSNPVNAGITFANNVWSDPTGSMGAESASAANDFSDTPPADTTSFLSWSNVYWNGGAALPSSTSELVNPDDDGAATVGNPLLPSHAGVVLPRWIPAQGVFADGSARIRRAFKRLVKQYGRPAAGSVVVGAADPAYTPTKDILRKRRDLAPDAGAFER